MRRVIVESPFVAADWRGVLDNIDYARRCLRDCLERGEAPFASHLLYTQSGVLDDFVPAHRALGIAAGHNWMYVAEAVVVYIDLGISPGMEAGIHEAKIFGLPIEYRRLEEKPE